MDFTRTLKISTGDQEITQATAGERREPWPSKSVCQLASALLPVIGPIAFSILCFGMYHDHLPLRPSWFLVPPALGISGGVLASLIVALYAEGREAFLGMVWSIGWTAVSVITAVPAVLYVFLVYITNGQLI